jgi:hypothetical protein
VVCDRLEILGDPVVTMDEAELLLTAEEIEQALPLP